MDERVAEHRIGGAAVRGGRPLAPLRSPVDGRPLGRVAAAGAALVDGAVAAAAAAFPAWAATPVKDRVQVLHRFRALLERDLDALAAVVSAENGKTPSEAAGGIRRGIEIVEFAAAAPYLAAGDMLEVSGGVDCYTRRLPLGVGVGITPFNFPAMVPLWMFPLALACGNAFLLKPSEQVPFTPLLLADLLAEAGLPPGVFSVLQGDRETAEALLDHPGVAAAAFVGSTPAARAVYRRGTSAGKRVLALGGAKNHLVVLPDADPEPTARNIVASAVGCAGQRCMAASVVIAVGDCEAILDRVEAEMRSLRCGEDVGAIISAAARERIEGYIARAAARGARLRPDGRGVVVPGKEGGNYVGPTLIDGVSPEDECARDEIFGPVLTVLRVATLDEALVIENRSPYGNAACLYTRDGAAARAFEQRAGAGMVGVNIGVPVPRDPFGFGGWNASHFGAGDISGPDALAFWTRARKVTVKWAAPSANWMS